MPEANFFPVSTPQGWWLMPLTDRLHILNPQAQRQQLEQQARMMRRSGAVAVQQTGHMHALDEMIINRVPGHQHLGQVGPQLLGEQFPQRQAEPVFGFCNTSGGSVLGS